MLDIEHCNRPLSERRSSKQSEKMSQRQSCALSQQSKNHSAGLSPVDFDGKAKNKGMGNIRTKLDRKVKETEARILKLKLKLKKD